MKKRVKVDDVRFIRYRNLLPEDLVERIKRLHPIIREVFPCSLDRWVDSFHYDINPDMEIEIWERMVEKFQSRLKMQGAKSKEEKKRIFGEIFYETDPANVVILEA